MVVLCQALLKVGSDRTRARFGPHAEPDGRRAVLQAAGASKQGRHASPASGTCSGGKEAELGDEEAAEAPFPSQPPLRFGARVSRGQEKTGRTPLQAGWRPKEGGEGGFRRLRKGPRSFFRGGRGG